MSMLTPKRSYCRMMNYISCAQYGETSIQSGLSTKKAFASFAHYTHTTRGTDELRARARSIRHRWRCCSVIFFAATIGKAVKCANDSAHYPIKVSKVTH